MRSPFPVSLLVPLAAGLVALPIYASEGQTSPPAANASPTYDASNAPQTVTEAPIRLRPTAPCRPIHFGFEGNPRKYEGQTLGRHAVPPGRTWRITNATVMMERHHGGPYAVAGEWTGWVGAVTSVGRVAISISSLDNGRGIALQGQGPVDVTLRAGEELRVSIWLRPYTSTASGARVATDPGNYYYTIGASGLDCPA